MESDIQVEAYIHTHIHIHIHTHIHTYIHTSNGLKPNLWGQKGARFATGPSTLWVYWTSFFVDVSVAEWLAWLTNNCGRIGAIGSSPSNGLRPNMWGQKGFNPLCQCVYIYVCIVNPDIQTIHRCSHTSIHTYIHTYVHTCISIHTYIHTYIQCWTSSFNKHVKHLLLKLLIQKLVS